MSVISIYYTRRLRRHIDNIKYCSHVVANRWSFSSSTEIPVFEVSPILGCWVNHDSCSIVKLRRKKNKQFQEIDALFSVRLNAWKSRVLQKKGIARSLQNVHKRAASTAYSPLLLLVAEDSVYSNHCYDVLASDYTRSNLAQKGKFPWLLPLKAAPSEGFVFKFSLDTKHSEHSQDGVTIINTFECSGKNVCRSHNAHANRDRLEVTGLHELAPSLCEHVKAAGFCPIEVFLQ